MEKDPLQSVPVPESLEYTEAEISAVNNTGKLPVSEVVPSSRIEYNVPPQAPHTQELHVYRSTSRRRSILLSTVLCVVLGIGTYLVIHAQLADKTDSYLSSSLNEALPDMRTEAEVSSLSDRELIVTTGLTVQGDTTLQGALVLKNGFVSEQDITVQGIARLGSLDVSGTTNIAGSLTVSGQVIAGNLQGNISGTFIGSSQGTFSGSGNGSFTGVFQGDGSKLTGLTIPDCKDCVRLQGPSSPGQTGNIVLAGDIRAQKLHLRAAINDPETFTVETATGEKIISADTLNKNITLGSLLPKTAGSSTAGTYSAGSIIDNSVNNVVIQDSTNAYSDGAHWATVGDDGFARFVYIDQNTSEVVFVRCTNSVCDNTVSTVVASDPVNWTDTASISLDTNGHAYISYIVYDSPNTVHLVHCSDQDCGATTNEIVSAIPYSTYISAVETGADGFARVIYNHYGAPEKGLDYVRCLNASCSSRSIQTVASNDGSGGYYESSDIAIAPNGNAYIAYSDDDGTHVMYCSDVTCSTVSNNLLPGGEYQVSIEADSNNMLRLAYEVTIPDPLTGITPGYIRFIACTTLSCSAYTQNDIPTGVADDSNSGVYSNVNAPSLLLINGLPLISFTASQSGSPQLNTLTTVQCQDASCTTYVSKVRSSDSDNLAQLYGDSTDTIGLIFTTTDNTFRHIKLNPDTVIPAVSVPALMVRGTNIGNSTQRFGQLFAQNIDLQTASTEPGLIVDQIGQNGRSAATGAIASFRINGTERVGIDADGALSLSDIDGVKRFKVDTSGKMTLGNTSLVQSTAAANLNIVASDNAMDLMHAYNSTGDQIFTITKDGNLTSGIPSSCNSCVPTTVLNKLQVDERYTVQRISREGNYMYVSLGTEQTPAAGSAHFQVYDVSDPLNPVLTSRFNGESAHGNFVVHNNYGYATTIDPGNKLLVFDLSNPAKPVLKTSLTPNPDTDLFDVAVQGNYLYVVGRSGLHIYSISNPELPVRIAFLALGSSAYGNYGIYIKPGSSTAIINNRTDGNLYSVDISNPAAPLLVSELPLGLYGGSFSGQSKMVVSDEVMYLSCANSNTSPCVDFLNPRILMMDISNPAAPSVIGSIPMGYVEYDSLHGNFPGMDVYMTTVDETLYVSLGHKIMTFDITNPSAPTLIESRTLSGHVNAFAVVGDMLYTSSYFGHELQIVGRAATASFQKVEAQTLQVAGNTTINGTTDLLATTTIGNGANLIVAGIPKPVPAYTSQSETGGSIPGTAGVTYYYKLTAITPRGESTPYSWSTTMKGLKWDFGNGYPSATAGSAGALTGTYRYNYTYVTAQGESTLQNSNTSTVTVSGRSVNLDNIYYPNDAGISAIKIYRCSMPACASYNLVGTITNPVNYPESFTDNNTTPGTAAPSVNNARTETNIVSFQFLPQDLPVGTTAIRLYKSTNNSNFTYDDTFVPPNGTVLVVDAGYTFTNSGTAPKSGTSGRLGVGTYDPAASLHVRGDTLLQTDENNVQALRIQDSSGANLLVADTVNMRLGIGLTSPSATLQVSASGTNGSLLRITDTTATAQDVLDIADTGVTTFRNQTNSTSAFRVQNAAATTILSVNTTNLRVEIGGGSDLHMAGAGNARNAITKNLTCTATEAVNDIVIITGAATVGRTTVVGSNRVAGIVVAKPTATTCTVAIGGMVQVNFGTNATPATIGDPVTTSAISGMAQSNTTPNPESSVGNSTSSKDGSNLVWVLMRGN